MASVRLNLSPLMSRSLTEGKKRVEFVERKLNRALMHTRTLERGKHLCQAITILQRVILARGSRVISPSIYEGSSHETPKGLVVLHCSVHLGIPFRTCISTLGLNDDSCTRAFTSANRRWSIGVALKVPFLILIYIHGVKAGIISLLFVGSPDGDI